MVANVSKLVKLVNLLQFCIERHNCHGNCVGLVPQFLLFKLLPPSPQLAVVVNYKTDYCRVSYSSMVYCSKYYDRIDA